MIIKATNVTLKPTTKILPNMKKKCFHTWDRIDIWALIEFYLTNILKLIGKTYVDCTSDHSSNEAEWCATEVKSDGEVVSGQWGDCDRKSLTCLTIGKSKFHH